MSLDQRLTARALALALAPDFRPGAAADVLATLAGGNRTALERALGRLGDRAPGRQSPVCQRAAVALRLALVVPPGGIARATLTQRRRPWASGDG